MYQTIVFVSILSKFTFSFNSSIVLQMFFNAASQLLPSSGYNMLISFPSRNLIALFLYFYFYSAFENLNCHLLCICHVVSLNVMIVSQFPISIKKII